MNKTQMAALLGRPLTSIEDTNYSTYLKIAQERLEDLTCLNLSSEPSERIYDVREGYTTVFTDLYTSVDSVKIDGNEISDYTSMQWDRRNASWYNSIVLETNAETVTVTADWGICSPELQLLTARLFKLLGSESMSSNIKSKKVEDFSITLNDNTVYQQFLVDNQALIDKFSLCSIGNIQHGSTRSFEDFGSYRSRVY